MKIKRKVSPLSIAKEKTYPNFFLFLLGFVVILAISFSTLAFIANQIEGDEVEDPSSLPQTEDVVSS